MTFDPAPLLIDHLNPRLGSMLDALESLVIHESPSREKPALDALLARIVTRFEAIGLSSTTLANPSGGDHVLMRSESSSELPPALVLMHYDTVWPLNTLKTMPFRIDDGLAYGPGVYDMKASLVIAEFALEALASLGLVPSRTVTLLCTSDEEIGSPSSRAIIEEEARKSAFVLVLEPPLPGGKLKTERKGVGRFNLTVTGRAVHAGVEPEKGINAVVELAHQILAPGELAYPTVGTTLNVGLIAGGTTPNVVPACATAAIDVRASTQQEADRVSRAIESLMPVLPGAKLEISGGFTRPPMERTPEVAGLYHRRELWGGLLVLTLAKARQAVVPTVILPRRWVSPHSTALEPPARGLMRTMSMWSSRSCPATPRSWLCCYCGCDETPEFRVPIVRDFG